MADVDGNHAQAARLLAAAESALRALRQMLDPDDAIEQKALRERLVTALGQEAFDNEYASGADLTPRQLLAISS
jgi:hypothetical protein